MGFDRGMSTGWETLPAGEQAKQGQGDGMHRGVRRPTRAAVPGSGSGAVWVERGRWGGPGAQKGLWGWD